MTKISALSDIGTSVASNDAFVLVDVSDPTTPNKKIQQQNLFLIPDGSAGTPAVRFLNDTDVGLFRPTTNTLALATGGSERLRIDSSGRVGIGTTAPGTTSGGLDIASGGIGLLLGADDGTNNRTNSNIKNSRIGSFHYTNSEEPIALLVGGSTATENLVSLGGGTSVFNTATALRFYTAENNTTTTGSERARIDSSGRLLVGTSTARSVGGAERLFQIEGTSTTNPFLTITQNSNVGGGSASALVLARTRGTSVGSQTAVQNNDVLGYLAFAGANGTDTSNYGGWITCEVDGDPFTSGDTTDLPGRLVFSTTADGASSPTERVRIDNAGTTTLTSAAATAPFIAKISTSEVARIDSSGKLLVGTSTAVGSSLLQVQGNISATGAVFADKQFWSTTTTGAATGTWTFNFNSADRRTYLIYAGIGSGDSSSNGWHRYILGVFIPVGGAGTALWTEISTGSVNTAASGDITITTSGKNNLVLTKTAGSSSSQMGITLNVVGGGSFVSVT